MPAEAAAVSAFVPDPKLEPDASPGDPMVDVVPVAAVSEAAAETEAKALVSGYLTIMVAGVPPSPQTSQALAEVVIGMVGTGMSVHPQCCVVMVIVIVVTP